jgi:TldD protein
VVPGSPETLCQNRRVAFHAIDAGALARWLAQLAEQAGDQVDLFLERREEAELPGDERRPGVALVREQGLAVRLVRQGRSYLGSADTIDGRTFADTVRRVARALPRTALPEPELAEPAWDEPVQVSELATFAESVREALRARLVAFPLRLRVRRHRRWVQVLGPQLLSPPEAEAFYSVVGETPWGRRGRLLADLAPGAAAELAEGLTELFRARTAPAPPRARLPVVLAPHASAVFLHEAVAHALEADLLALGGHPEAAIGFELAGSGLSLLDDPGAGPEPVRRTTDDEGMPVLRRWLLRSGRVEQPLADGLWARACPRLLPGSGWRGSRHALPMPRCRHLEVVPGEVSPASLWRRAEGGLVISDVDRGALDPHTGWITLEASAARRVRDGAPAEPVGRCRLRGRVADLLSAVAGVAHDLEEGGAGWCAKGGQRLPVWARSCSLLLGEVEVTP